MYAQKESLDKTAAPIPSEKHRTTRIGTLPKPELAHSRNGTPVTFAARQGLILLHQPLENMRRPEFDAPTKNFHALGSSGKGIRDGWDQQVFSRETHRHRGFIVCDFPVVGLRRWHECRSFGINFPRGEDYSPRQYGRRGGRNAVLGA